MASSLANRPTASKRLPMALLRGSVASALREGLSGKSRGNLLPVKAPVLDKNLPGVAAAHHYSRQMNSWHIALKRIRIQLWLARHRIELHAQAFDEPVVRVIPRERKNVFRGDAALALWSLHHHGVASKLLHCGVEQSRDFAGLQPILDVRLDPILDRRTQLLPAMHQRHVRAIAVQLQRSNGRRIFSANYHHVLPPVFERVRVVVRDMREVLA